jgi:hypothetical protein
MSKPRDLSFEALAHETSTDWTVGRGELNAALKSIRSQSSELEDVELATEIVYRAKLYRTFMGEGIALTAGALAKHWRRVREQAVSPSAQTEGEARPRVVTNASARDTGCPTCDGMGMVLVTVRPSLNPQSGYEEWGICPDCRGFKLGGVIFP